jgi:hypothetical protein
MKILPLPVKPSSKLTSLILLMLIGVVIGYPKMVIAQCVHALRAN